MIRATDDSFGLETDIVTCIFESPQVTIVFVMDKKNKFGTDWESVITRLIPRVTIVECLVIAFIAFILYSLLYDDSRAGKQDGATDAKRDIEAGEFKFRIGGRRRPLFDTTAEIFEERHGAKLVRSHGSCAICYEMYYDQGYNETVAESLGISFYDAYWDADEEALRRFQARE